MSALALAAILAGLYFYIIGNPLRYARRPEELNPSRIASLWQEREQIRGWLETGWFAEADKLYYQARVKEIDESLAEMGIVLPTDDVPFP